MDKAIEIKRRAQRCIQNGDLDGALSEYEKLIAIEDSDPYNFVLLADLMFKKGDTSGAGQRYLGAAAAYEKAGLYKNAIAVCKKLMRLQLAPMQVYQRLGALHSLDGLSTEGSLYYQQHAEHLLRDKKLAEAAESLRLAYETSNENVKALERLGEVQAMLGDDQEGARSLARAVREYAQAGLLMDAERCRRRAVQLDPSIEVDAVTSDSSGDPAPARAEAAVEPAARSLESAFENADEIVLPEEVQHEEIVPLGDPSAESAAAASPGHMQMDPDFMPTAKSSSSSAPRLELTSDLDPASVAGEAEPVDETPAPAPPAIPRFEPPKLKSKPSAPLPTPSVAKGAAPKPPAAKSAASPAAPAPKSAPSAPAPKSAPARAKSAPPEPAELDEVTETPVESDGPPVEIGGDVRYEPIGLDESVEEIPQKPAARISSPDTPGLRFQGTGAPRGAAPSLSEVERMLSKAQDCFRAGQREAASEALAGAACAYDELGRFDSAATIYRSLGKSAHATNEMLELWLVNCQHRQDNAEAAQVACELGDRALNEGQTVEARGWFESARDFDATNEVSLRRLQRLGGAPAKTPERVRAELPTVAAARAAENVEPVRRAPPPRAPAAEPPPTGDGDVPGRVEVAVGRGEAVSFDLGSLIEEFQRGVETQLSGDAQGHYDLGMSYREMGLLEQAVDSFRIAAEDPLIRLRAAEMIGRCLLDQGQFDEAIAEFEGALKQPALEPEARMGLLYEIGVAHEAAGRARHAIGAFQRVYAEQPDYPDVELKIRALRKTLETA